MPRIWICSTSPCDTSVIWFATTSIYIDLRLCAYNYDTRNFPKLQVRNIGESKDLQMWASAVANLIALVTPSLFMTSLNSGSGRSLMHLRRSVESKRPKITLVAESHLAVSPIKRVMLIPSRTNRATSERALMKADVRIAEHEGTLVDEAKCPKCRIWAIVSPEQAIGKICFPLHQL